jgi:hypothetical protein
VSVIKLNVFLADAAVEGETAVESSTLGISVPGADTECIDAEEERKADRETHEGKEDPVLSHLDIESDTKFGPNVQ